MIERRCDICKKKKKRLNTIILYKKVIDYCESPKCIDKVYQIKKQFRKDVKQEYLIFENNIRKIEKAMYDKL